jgi:hypothetical protein
MRQSENEKGQCRDEKRDRNECYGNFEGHEILKDRIRDHDFADLIPNGLEEIADVQRITSFLVMRYLFLFRLI